MSCNDFLVCLACTANVRLTYSQFVGDKAAENSITDNMRKVSLTLAKRINNVLFTEVESIIILVKSRVDRSSRPVIGPGSIE